MIKLYSGTPGSGKSYHVARDILTNLRMGRNVITNIEINLDIVTNNGKRKIGDYTYVSILDMTTQYLFEYAYKTHKKGQEGQTLIVLDECQIIFNPREFGRGDRKDWILFFTKHRHLGYNVILITQFDRLLDRQIRCLLEYEVKHRKCNNRGALIFLPFTFFVSITIWYGVREKLSSEFFIYRKKYAQLYDSYVMFEEAAPDNPIEANEENETIGSTEAPRRGRCGGGGRGTLPERRLRRGLRWFTESFMSAAIKD